MKPSIALLAALFLAPCACTRGEHAAPPTAMAAVPIDPGPSVAPATPPAPAPAVAEPAPQPTPEEVAAFHARVPK